jgi:hypothetical protein
MNALTDRQPSSAYVFIDRAVTDYASLQAGVRAGYIPILLDPERDGIAQITEQLQQAPLPVYIVAHGSPGALTLGNSQLNLDTLAGYADRLATWKTPNIYLYSCNVAAGDAGAEFISKLARLTGASIAAAAQPVGNPALGGTWQLTEPSGRAANATAFIAATERAYSGVFALSFANQNTFGVGFAPTSVAIGDFNGDLISDLVTDNLFSDNVSVLLGDGLGGFSPQTTFGVGIRPRSVAIGDFNGDSISDLVTTNGGDILSIGSDNVSVLLGDGLGGFSPQTTFGKGIRPFSVAIGDFNGDSISDLVTTNVSNSLFSGNVSVLLGDGLGGFSPQSTFGVGISPYDVAIGDFNGDLISDLVTTNGGSNNVSILLGDGLGGFSPQSTFGVGIRPSSVAIGDFNGDLISDLVTNNYSSNNVSVLLGDGLGGFSPQTTFGVGNTPFSVAIGDFNGDLISDLVTTNGGNISILLGDGLGGFSPPSTFGERISHQSVAIGDFNGDLISDLVTTNPSSNNVSVLLNTTTPPNSPPVAGADTVTTGFNKPVTISVATLLANDTDPDLNTTLSITGVSSPTNGNVSFNNKGTATTADDEIVFIPTNGFSDDASFNYTLSDGTATTPGTVTVSVGKIINVSDTILGGDGNDNLEGNDRNNTIYGGNGRDTILGGDGNDFAYGGLGDDFISGGTGIDNLEGNEGNDTILGDDGDDGLAGQEGDDSLIGGNGDDRLYGWTGNDTLYGESGLDTLFGDDGDDFAFGGTGNDSISGDNGIDNLEGNEGDDTILGGDGNDGLAGQEGDDSLVGGNGNDRLYGWLGNDTLEGDGSDDSLYGGSGNDLLTGGAGADTFNFGNDFVTGEAFISLGLDTITDFQLEVDKIQLQRSAFSALPETLSFAIVTDDSLAVTSNEIIVYSQGTGSIFYNANGSADGFGAGGSFAILTGNPSLAAIDFELLPATVGGTGFVV